MKLQLPAQSGAGARAPGMDADVRLESPVFIVSWPRSGSTLLFETLSAAPGVYTVGGESHELIEGVPGLAPGDGALADNRLDAGFATPEVVAQLRERFVAQLADRAGRRPQGTVRMLEKTPKNSLRVPFLKAAFPGARFIYLHRDPREILASMIEGWQSGRFITYANLPGWQGLPWSFLLVPGWQALAGKPLADVVAAQWETTTRILLDDLQSLSPGEWTAVEHAELLARPQATAHRLARWAGWGWDRELGDTLPLSGSTLTPPDPQKWRKHAADVEPRLAMLSAQVERAALAARQTKSTP